MDDVSGLIFHIIHGSFVDGYGVRTTVLLKECPLRCIWCCNPEGQRDYPEIKLTPESCDICGRCIQICPANAIRLNPPDGDVNIKLDRGLCTNCGKCVEVCYTGALEFFGKYVTVDELFDIVKKDEQYYRASEGGVTIGGGEPTLQPVFTSALIKKCRENYIHTAVDTCGYTLTSDGFRALEEADLLLFDIKGMDPVEHLHNTGFSNEPILANLKKLDAMRKSIIVRLPLIPGYTDSSKNIQLTAEFLSELKSLERVDLLAYHQYGKIKYEQLGRECKMGNQKITREFLNYVQDTIERHGIKVQIGG